MGLFNLLGIPFAWVLAQLYKLIGNYGITLILFTTLVSLALLPLMGSQLKNSGKMTALQPKIAEIQTRYADDKETMNRKLQELYAKEHYSPTSGCAPSIVQLIVVMALFAVLRDPLAFTSVVSDSLAVGVHESFLWISDMSQPDLWILPILAGVTQFFTTKASGSMQSTGSSSMNKMMLYFFPVMLVWLGRSMPAGLCLYWVIRSLISIVQAAVLSKKRRHEALRAEVEREFQK